MKFTDKEHLELLARHGWRGTPWEDRTAERQAELKRTSWLVVLEVWVVGAAFLAPALIWLWNWIAG